jgi:cell division protein FtsN
MTASPASAVPPPLVSGAASATAAARPAARDPAAILSGGATPPPPAAAAKPVLPGVDPFVYFVQAGAYTRSEDAEQQRARLALLGQGAKVTEREQAGRTVYRVRLGPYNSREEADGVQAKLQEQTIEAQIVRVEKP